MEIRDTERRSFSSKHYEAPFEIDIFLPKSYATSNKNYPVVYILDAEYNFGLTSYVTRRLIKNKDIEEVILVGIAYDVVYETFYRARGRDLTPTHHKSFIPSGQSAKFLNFLSDELIPFIEKNYRTQKVRAIVGHSFGGLFGYSAMFSGKSPFQKYLLVSPSLWWDEKVIFRIEQDFAKKNNAIRAKVFTSVGDVEGKMVKQLAQMVKVLKSRNYNGLEISHRVHEDENHRSVFATAFSKGMRHLFRRSSVSSD